MCGGGGWFLCRLQSPPKFLHPSQKPDLLPLSSSAACSHTYSAPIPPILPVCCIPRSQPIPLPLPFPHPTLHTFPLLLLLLLLFNLHLPQRRGRAEPFPSLFLLQVPAYHKLEDGCRNGVPYTLKAHIVAMGNGMNAGIKFHITFASKLAIFFAITAKHKLLVKYSGGHIPQRGPANHIFMTLPHAVGGKIPKLKGELLPSRIAATMGQNLASDLQRHHQE